MSRHLMAKMRRSAAQPVKWQDGMVLPHTAADMANPRRTGLRDWRPEHVSTAIVHHGEKLHALQVNKEIGLVGPPYLWSIHEHDGHTDPKVGGWEHLDPADHDHECSMCEAGPGEKCLPDCWDQNSRTGGGMRNTLEDTLWQDGSRGDLWGYQPDRGSAQKAAETAWAKYTGENGHGLGDFDPGTIGPIVPEPGGQNPDDDYGDFSGLFGGGK
jgi:hypothetical protein